MSKIIVQGFRTPFEHIEASVTAIWQELHDLISVIHRRSRYTPPAFPHPDAPRCVTPASCLQLRLVPDDMASHILDIEFSNAVAPFLKGKDGLTDNRNARIAMQSVLFADLTIL